MNKFINQVLIFISIVSIIVLAASFPANSENANIELLNKKVEQLDKAFQKNAALFDNRLLKLKDEFQDRAAFLEVIVAELRIANTALEKKLVNQHGIEIDQTFFDNEKLLELISSTNAP